MFDLANLSVNVVILILRGAVVLLLYFFLWQVLRVVLRDLRAGAQPVRRETSLYGNLVIMASGQTGLPVGKTFPLSPTTIIGRSMDTDVALNDTFLSNEHARLVFQGSEWLLEDMGSTNGTFVNGFEVRAPTAINIGDVIRIGRVELQLTR